MLKPIAFFSPNQSNPQENAAELGGRHRVGHNSHIERLFSFALRRASNNRPDAHVLMETETK
jgi:hypothetical protein